MKTEPQPLADTAPQTPAEVQAIAARALKKDRSERYESVKDLELDRRAVKHHLDSDNGRQRLVTSRVIAPETKTWKISAGVWWMGAAAAVLILSIAAVFEYAHFSTNRAINSLAVLPFANTSGDGKLEYLADGISDGLIASLSELPQLKVIARNSVFRYKGKEIDPRASSPW